MTPQKPKCPVCGKPQTPEQKPFCSKRCANVDLHRWLNGAYVIAGENADPDSADDELAPPPTNEEE